MDSRKDRTDPSSLALVFGRRPPVRRFVWLVVMLALAPFARGQTITQIQTVPPGLQVTNANTIQATFTLAGFTPPVSVQFQRDDLATDTVSGLNNGPGTITLVLS